MAIINLNLSNISAENEFDPTPADEYNAQVIETEMKLTRDGTGHYIEAKFEIMDGQYAKRKTFQNFHIQPGIERFILPPLLGMGRRRAVMQDLNDLYYFVQVVRHGGFTAASRALNIPKSRLSRRITQLEEHLGVRLLQRTTRQLALTDIGESFYRHCQEVVADAEAAQAAVEQARAEPHGQVRFSCPIALAQTLVVGALAEFMRRYPRIWVSMTVTNDEVNMIREGLAVAIHSQLSSANDSSQVSRHLGNAQFLLVASPQYLDYQGRPQSPEALAGMDCLQSAYLFGRNEWPLTRSDGAARTISFRPRMEADELLVLKRAAVLGLGVMALPRLLCMDELESGLLEVILPEWMLPTIHVHLSYPSRRGMVPAVRHFIDYMTERIPVLFTV